MKHSGTEKAHVSPAVQAREWARRRIVSSDYDRLYSEVWNEPDVFADEDEDFDDWGGYGGERLQWDVALGYVREAANHYPHPLNGQLLDAALARLVPHCEPYIYQSACIEAVDTYLVDDLIKNILEEPDALLG